MGVLVDCHQNLSYTRRFISTYLKNKKNSDQVNRSQIVDVYIRGEIHWLQPPYSAVSCRHLIQEMLYIAVEHCSILAATRGYKFSHLSIVEFRD